LAGANRPPKTDELGLPTGEDGVLTAEEIVNLNLAGTELVVLSACETGLGKVAGGEGVTGLARAFHLAGTRNVVVSLWKVEDKATAALMKVFYYQLWHEGKMPIEAIREAQLTLYRHPEQIDALASGDRSLKDPANPVKLPDGGRRSETATKTPPKLWAGFILSGPGD
jgi:CHAT domain-containing protein